MWFYTRPVFGYRRCYPDMVYAFRLLIVALERVENDKRKKKTTTLQIISYTLFNTMVLDTILSYIDKRNGSVNV